MKDIINLKNIIEKKQIKITENSYFFHFAWGGENRLSDLNVKAQLKNVLWTKDAFNISEEIGIKKFIFVGTMEEKFAQKYLNLNHKEDNFYNRHVIYALAKSAARKTLKTIYHNKKIELIFATNSHVMGPNDERDSFLQNTLKKILLKQDLLLAPCDKYFDVISSYDCARAYKLVAEKGKNLKEYWIGSGEPKILKEYVRIISEMYSYDKDLNFNGMNIYEIALSKSDFSTEDLLKDTGFKTTMSFKDTVLQLAKTL